MSTQFWINLPVQDPERSRDFFSAIGFRAEPQHPETDGTGILVGDNEVRLMLFPRPTFQRFTQHGLPDTGKTSQVLFSFSAVGREEVDELARKVEVAGGTIFAPPAEIQGWMYGCAFTDLDGHRWNVLHMPLPEGGGGELGSR